MESNISGKVLVVDDDADVREVLRESLELCGADVVEASDGRQALEILAHTRDLRLVLLDLRMPVVSGPEFLAAKARMPGCAGVPVVVVSATDPDPSLLEHAAGFLHKPTKLQPLLDYVERFCPRGNRSTKRVRDESVSR